MNAFSRGKSFSQIICLVTAILFVFCGCSPDGDPNLIGKWQPKDGKDILEIKKNGDWVEGKKDADITSCTWEWEGTNHIRITANHKLVGKATGVMKVTLNGDTLILKDEDGAREYTRVK